MAKTTTRNTRSSRTAAPSREFTEKILKDFGVLDGEVIRRSSLPNERFIGNVQPLEGPAVLMAARPLPQISGNSDWVPERDTVARFRFRYVQVFKNGEPLRKALTATLEAGISDELHDALMNA